MKFNEALSILKLLGTRHEDAMTIQQIVVKWNAAHTEVLQLRTAQRYLSELSTDGADGNALVEVDASSKERRYHLSLSEMANWFSADLSCGGLQGRRSASVRSRKANHARHV